MCFLTSLLLLRIRFEHVNSAANFSWLVELFVDSSDLVIPSLLCQIDGRLVAEASHHKQNLDRRDDKRHGPDDAEVLVDIEVGA